MCLVLLVKIAEHKNESAWQLKRNNLLFWPDEEKEKTFQET